MCASERGYKSENGGLDKEKLEPERYSEEQDLRAQAPEHELGRASAVGHVVSEQGSDFCEGVRDCADWVYEDRRDAPL